MVDEFGNEKISSIKIKHEKYSKTDYGKIREELK